MCSILILRHVHPELPLILAANRDELLDRPTSGPQRLPGTPRIGLHVLPNDTLDCPELPKVARARMLAAEHARRPWPELALRLQEVLADHHLPADAQLPAFPSETPASREWTRQLQALCIHTPAYGTRSSALLALSPGRVAHLQASESPPCHTAFQDFWSLLALT